MHILCGGDSCFVQTVCNEIKHSLNLWGDFLVTRCDDEIKICDVTSFIAYSEGFAFQQREEKLISSREQNAIDTLHSSDR